MYSLLIVFFPLTQSKLVYSHVCLMMKSHVVLHKWIDGNEHIRSVYPTQALRGGQEYNQSEFVSDEDSPSLACLIQPRMSLGNFPTNLKYPVASEAEIHHGHFLLLIWLIWWQIPYGNYVLCKKDIFDWWPYIYWSQLFSLKSHSWGNRFKSLSLYSHQSFIVLFKK